MSFRIGYGGYRIGRNVVFPSVFLSIKMSKEAIRMQSIYRSIMRFDDDIECLCFSPKLCVSCPSLNADVVSMKGMLSSISVSPKLLFFALTLEHLSRRRKNTDDDKQRHVNPSLFGAISNFSLHPKNHGYKPSGANRTGLPVASALDRFSSVSRQYRVELVELVLDVKSRSLESLWQ